MWKHIKEQVQINTKKETILPSHINNPVDINSHFLNIPSTTQVDQSTLTFYQSRRFNSSVFKFKLVDENIVLKTVNEIKSQAVGVDDISLDMFLLTLPQSLPTLTHIINRSFQTNTFPHLWRQALVYPVPKNKTPDSLKDLRPISVLPCLSKVIEKIVHKQLMEYLELHSILPEHQSGFRKHRGTATALMDVVDNMLCAQEDGRGTIMLLLDYSRAFDTIDIALLLSKLVYYGLGDNCVKWFESYLSNQTQTVSVLNEDGTRSYSNTSIVTRGVPQGSILGPLLFILYSADVVKIIKNCNYQIYADDIQLYYSFHPNETLEAINKVNSDLNDINLWSERNSLILNPSKTKFMILGNPKIINRINQFDINVLINNRKLDRVHEARNLGIIFDENLRFEKHINTIISNCFYRLKTLYRIRKYIDTSLRIRLCDALVLSKFHYADTMYGPRLLSRTKAAIQRVQNACARYCWNIPPRTHVSPYIRSAKILNMEARRRLHFATLLFGVMQTKVPSYLYQKLAWMGERSALSYQTRSAFQKLAIPRHHSAGFKGSFRYSATKCWNNLPPPLRNLRNKENFRRKYRNHLLLNPP
ncbi:unnamed protein product [Colias eurytheme]|nr:unnamed protein product [Colias eurytheme]